MSVRTTFPKLALLRLKLCEEDKKRHMVWSFWITLGALLLLPAAHAVLAAVAIGLLKEVWDHFYGSGFCFFDLAGNTLGTLAALVCYTGALWGYVTLSAPPLA